MQALGCGIETAVNFESRVRSRRSGPEIVAGEGFKQAPFLEDIDDVGSANCVVGSRGGSLLGSGVKGPHRRKRGGKEDRTVFWEIWV